MFPPMKTHYLVVEHVSIKDLAQSTSQYPEIWVFPLTSYNKPCLEAFLRYFKMQVIAFQ